MDKIKLLLKKYREVLLYLIFGGLTTLVNIAVYAVLARALSMDVTLSTAVAWVVSVIFAYFTNRTWVFNSRAKSPRAVAYEVAAFFGGRAFSGLLDVGIMFLFAERLGMNDLLIKILSNILVIILNYILSKWLVFRKRKVRKTERKGAPMADKQTGIRREVFSWIKTIVISIGAVVLLNTFFVVNAQIPSESMENTLEVHDRLLALRTAYVNEDPARFDIVVFRYPDDESQLFIKRVIGLPGETVEGRDGLVYVNGVPLEEPYCKEKDIGPAPDAFGPFEVPEDCYFMMGDNRGESWDSRFWDHHFVTRGEIVGKAMFKYYPRFEKLY